MEKAIKVYIDITSTLAHPTITGIQRFVIEVVLRIIANQADNNVEVVLLNHNRDYNFSICDQKLFFGYFTQAIGTKLQCITTRRCTLDDMESNSIWLELDAAWVSRIPRTLLYPELKKRNIRIGVFVQDLIAFSHPHMVHEDTLIRFPMFMGAVFDHADIIYTSAQFTCDEIKRIAKEVDCKREIVYQIATLGANFLSGAKSNEEVAPVAREIAEKGKILLTVSTIEGRKNHKVILDAFDQALCDEGYQVVFVGKSGWLVDELLDRIHHHPEINKSLYHLEGMNDATVHYLYQQAHMVLFPSYIEGFGLSTVEAMEHGTPVVLSNVPIMREIGGEFCDYFDPDNPEELIKVIEKYEQQPKLYVDAKEKMKQYQPPTWEECTRRILEAALNILIPPVVEHEIRQIVYLSARMESLLPSLKYVDKLMPFITRALVFCPDTMAKKLRACYCGRLELTCVTDDELLGEYSLPEDHATRNFFLRCLAMKRPEIDLEFIMSDDDYRPLERIDVSTFVKDGRYQAYYFYDLDRWHDIVVNPTSFDQCMFKTNEFLKRNGYPNLQYASHMPQVINKKWYLEMLDDYPELPISGCDEWSTYFNYAISKYHNHFDVCPYVTLSWPGMESDWRKMVIPKSYKFENFYDELYQKNAIFAQMQTEYSDSVALESLQKILICEHFGRKVTATSAAWKEYEDSHSQHYQLMPSFVLVYGDNVKTDIYNPPLYIELKINCTYYIPIKICKVVGDRIAGSTDSVRIGYSFGDQCVVGEGKNNGGEGQAIMGFTASRVPAQTKLNLYCALSDDEKMQHVCSIPVTVSPL